MKSKTGLIAALCVFGVLCGCGPSYKPIPADLQKSQTSVAATNPVSVAEAGAEYLDVVSSKSAGEDNDSFKVSATLKAKKAMPSSAIYLIGQVMVSKDGKKAEEGTAEAAVPGPWDLGATKDVAFNVNRYGSPGERTIVIKWVRDRPPGD